MTVKAVIEELTVDHQADCRQTAILLSTFLWAKCRQTHGTTIICKKRVVLRLQRWNSKFIKTIMLNARNMPYRTDKRAGFEKIYFCTFINPLNLQIHILLEILISCFISVQGSFISDFNYVLAHGFFIWAYWMNYNLVCTLSCSRSSHICNNKDDWILEYSTVVVFYFPKNYHI